MISDNAFRKLMRIEMDIQFAESPGIYSNYYERDSKRTSG